MNDRDVASGWSAAGWMALLVAASLALSLGFACATPLAGIGAVAALTLRHRVALGLMLTVWFANQLAGFLILGYPPTINAFAWGLAIGIAALLAMEAARFTAIHKGATGRRLRAAGLGFAAAFTVFELALFAASITALGGLGAYTPAIIARILAINAATAGVLFAIDAVATQHWSPRQPSSFGRISS